MNNSPVLGGEKAPPRKWEFECSNYNSSVKLVIPRVARDQEEYMRRESDFLRQQMNIMSGIY